MAASTFRWGGREWGPGQRAAFASYLRAHGGDFRTWASAHPGAAKLLIPQSLDSIISSRAQAALQPELDALDAERKRAAAEAAQGITNTKGIYAALAEALKGLAPATQGVYQQAAGATAGFGKGFADATAELQGNEKASLGDFLGKIGAPSDLVSQAQAQLGGTGVQDVQYGLGGYIPASTLEREGAGFTTAALQQPYTALGTGAQEATILGRDALRADQGYADQRAALLDKLPGLSEQIRQQIIENARADRALAIQEGYLGVSNRKTTAELTGVDPVTGIPYAGSGSAKEAARASRDAAKARTAARHDREQAFVTARRQIFGDAAGLRTELSADDKIAWAVSHPGRKASDAPDYSFPDYATAKRNLFNEYKYLLNYATPSGRAKLKRRLNQMIDEALAAAGLKRSPGRRRRRATRPDDRPGIRGPVY